MLHRFSCLSPFLFAAVVWASLPSAATAQQTLAHDTLGGGTPVGITCGFCATEKYGVVFRDLPDPLRGLLAEDFPLTLRSVLVAVANARVIGSAGEYQCVGEAIAGEANVDMEVWAGSTPIEGSIRELPVEGAWNDSETLVWGDIDVPLTRSAAESDGSPRYLEAAFNELMLVDEEGEPIVVEDATYLRVVLTFKPDGTDRSASCANAGNESPAAFPMRDGDGVVASERSFGYALGVGWFWNEEAGFNIGGDWAIRMSITPSAAPPADAGVPDAGSDAGADAGDPLDAGVDSAAPDASGASDAGPPPTDEGGCAIGGSTRTPAMFLLLVGLLLARRRVFAA